MTPKHYLVTGGTGFLGSALVRQLLTDGHRVRVLDNNSRGSSRRLADVLDSVELIDADVRDPEAVERACRGVNSVCHLAYVNGTEFFYSKPDVVLDVGVRGMLNLIDGCKAAGVGELVLASSSEVYQSPPTVPTDESAALSVPDPWNPRYSYGGGKLISELMALHWAATFMSRVVIFRPHNVYGPDMGNEHVIPQFSTRLAELSRILPHGVIDLPIEGSGLETRSFVYVDDFIGGVRRVMDWGRHLGIYHIGTEAEIAIADLAHEIGGIMGRDIRVVPGGLKPGGTQRRCPDISRARELGYVPRVDLREGLARTVPWYTAAALEGLQRKRSA